jgi:hypothetical protein
MVLSYRTTYTHSADFPGLVATANCSVLISTYQAGQLCALGTGAEQLHVQFEPFPRAMGIAIHPSCVSVASGGMIWKLESAGAA